MTVRLLVLQPTPFCNLDCTYCYLPARDDRRRMSREVLEAAFRRVRESGFLARELSVVWHAGEPLVVGPDFYRMAFGRASEILGDEVSVTHSIQTNGVLVDDRWCALFREAGVRVGVSVDGPAFIHDRHRKTRRGRPTHADVMVGIRRLRAAGIPFHVIAVLTRESLDHAEQMVEFFVSEGITDVGFNIDEQEGVHPHSTAGSQQELLEGFLAGVLRHTRAQGSQLRIREFTRAADLIAHGLPSSILAGIERPDNLQIHPWAITIVAFDGCLSTFSPELLGQKDPRHGDFVFGNVLTDRIADATQSGKFQAVFREILAGVEECARSCEFFSLCGGGAPANKLYECGTFKATETSYCKSVIQLPIRLVLEEMEFGLGIRHQSPVVASPS